MQTLSRISAPPADIVTAWLAMPNLGLRAGELFGEALVTLVLAGDVVHR